MYIFFFIISANIYLYIYSTHHYACIHALLLRDTVDTVLRYSFPEYLVMDPVCRQGGQETYVSVASETSSNQQVVFFWLPCMWWNRKPYIIWAFPVVANRHREGGTNIPVKILSVKLSHHRNRLRKKNHATTQILPMEEGQDAEACSVNEKNVCSLAA